MGLFAAPRAKRQSASEGACVLAKSFCVLAPICRSRSLAGLVQLVPRHATQARPLALRTWSIRYRPYQVVRPVDARRHRLGTCRLRYLNGYWSRCLGSVLGSTCRFPCCPWSVSRASVAVGPSHILRARGTGWCPSASPCCRRHQRVLCVNCDKCLSPNCLPRTGPGAPPPGLRTIHLRGARLRRRGRSRARLSQTRLLHVVVRGCSRPSVRPRGR